MADLPGSRDRVQVAFVPMGWDASSTSVPGVVDAEYAADPVVEECHTVVGRRISNWGVHGTGGYRPQR